MIPVGGQFAWIRLGFHGAHSNSFRDVGSAHLTLSSRQSNPTSCLLSLLLTTTDSVFFFHPRPQGLAFLIGIDRVALLNFPMSASTTITRLGEISLTGGGSCPDLTAKTDHDANL